MDWRFAIACLLILGLMGRTSAEEISPESVEFFEKKIRPVLVEHCYRCHSGESKAIKGGLRVDGRTHLLKGGETGPSIVPGEPTKSRLIEAIGYMNTALQMPPKGKLSTQAIQDLTAWVKMGAPWPGEKITQSEVKPKDFDLAERKARHWSWKPIQTVEAPTVKDTAWSTHMVDRFILAGLEAKGIQPAPAADRLTWIRRVTFALIGLPPRPEEIDAFLADSSEQAYAKVVDRLLQSPHFGERWARHWLDLVRYAETRGHEFEPIIPNAYQYRDYVIRAFNADVPYNQFVLEHLAGDRLEQPRLHPTEGFNESILGTGFWFLGEELHSPVDIRQDQADRFDNRIDVFSKTFLGLTVACARCHDHKFDAISTRDYYALFGLLESSSYRQVRFDGWQENRKVAAAIQELRTRGRKELLPALASAALAGKEPVLDYLRATRDVLTVGPLPKLSNKPLRPEELSVATRDRLREIARERNLKEARLQGWVLALLDARGDVTHPLYLWYKLASDPKTSDPTIFRERLAAELKSRAAPAMNADIVVDYSRSNPSEWLPDGEAYGPAPLQPGDLRATATNLRIAGFPAAELDRFWDGLLAAPGSEKDAGSLGQRVRAGRTIRTPTFTLKAKNLYYLVKGTGMAYAAVSAHTMLAGPLHGQLVSGFNAPDGYRWIQHSLAPYQGLKLHLELTPNENSDFSLLMVVQADQPPPLPEALRLSLALLGEGKEPTSLDELGERFARNIARAYQEVRQGRVSISSGRLLQTLLDQPDLWNDGNEASKKIDTLITGLIAEHATLGKQVKRVSRLALGLLDGNGVDEAVFIRGSPRALGSVVPRRFLEALAGDQPLKAEQGSGRLELAREFVEPAKNPFISRVIVNRIWHHLFGRGIVASVDNFGVLGEQPSHPELLDYLADHFVREGWSIKKLIRELVLSRTYRMASRADADAEEKDPGNRLFHRMNIKRLEGEAIRDAMLVVSGRLNPKSYGPSVLIHLTPFLDGRGRPGSGPIDGDGRRSLYLATRRNFLSPFLQAFDTPIPFSTVGRRQVSNVPAQALILLNDPFVHQMAALWAKQTLAHPGTAEDRVTWMFRQAFGRPAEPAELQDCLAFVREQAERLRAPADDPRAWTDLAHTLFNVKEFIYVP